MTSVDFVFGDLARGAGELCGGRIIDGAKRNSQVIGQCYVGLLLAMEVPSRMNEKIMRSPCRRAQ